MAWLISQALMRAYENSHCSLEPEAESLAVTCSDGEPSVPSNGNLTPQAYCAPDKMMAFSRLSRYGMTFAPLTDDSGEALSMWCREGSRARTSASQEPAKDSTASAAACGARWPASLAKYDPASHSLRTVQHSLLEDSTASSVTLPRSGSMRSGECCQRPTLARSMFGKGSGLWPTTTVCGNYNRKGSSKTSGDGLATAVAKAMWPTPTACMSKGSSEAALVRKDGRDRSTDRLDHAVMASDRGQLNPEWVEWLMGWPLGHTDLRPLETGKFHEWQQQHSIYFAKGPDGE